MKRHLSEVQCAATRRRTGRARRLAPLIANKCVQDRIDHMVSEPAATYAKMTRLLPYGRHGLHRGTAPHTSP